MDMRRINRAGMWLREVIYAWARLFRRYHWQAVSSSLFRYTDTSDIITLLWTTVPEDNIDRSELKSNVRISSLAGSMKRLGSSSGVSPPPLRRKVESTTTSELCIFHSFIFNLVWEFIVNTKSEWSETAVASFFTPVSKKKPEKISWRIVNKSLLAGKYTSGPIVNGQTQTAKRRKVAAFDLVCAD